MALPALAQQLNFVACPVVRDTKTVPCFLAEYQGETYFLGIQQDITAAISIRRNCCTKRWWRERSAPGPRVCGGIPLKPLHVSVLAEVNRACNTILPAEPGIDAPPAKRPAGPSTRQAPVSTAAVAPKKPEPPFGEREFVIRIRLRQRFSVCPQYPATYRYRRVCASVSSAKPSKSLVTGHPLCFPTEIR